MSRKEFTAVSEFLGMTTDDFIKTYAKHVLYRDGQVAWIHFANDGASCVFLDDETNYCKIHPVKPIQCRAYPFYPNLLASPEAWDAECRRADDDMESPLPPWTTTAAGCEGMKPIGSEDFPRNDGVPLQTVLEQVYEYEQNERDLFGDKYKSEW